MTGGVGTLASPVVAIDSAIRWHLRRTRATQASPPIHITTPPLQSMRREGLLAVGEQPLSSHTMGCYAASPRMMRPMPSYRSGEELDR